MYQVLIEHEGVWRAYGAPCERMGEAYKFLRICEKARPYRKYRVVNLVNYEVEQWAGREAGHEGD